jgi:hypothetical protein
MSLAICPNIGHESDRTLEDGMGELRATVQREERADLWADLGGLAVDYRTISTPSFVFRGPSQIAARPSSSSRPSHDTA